MTDIELIITVLIVALVTAGLRFAPFLLFPQGKHAPVFVTWLGKQLPRAAMAMLLVYCLKDMNATTASGFVPTAMGVLVTVLLHVWKREMMLSIAGGTFLYMLLIRLMT